MFSRENIMSNGMGDTTNYNGNTQANGSSLPESLLAMGSDLTLKAKQHKIDPIIGRQKEIERIIEILCRKTKNNPVLIGEAGVGKSAIIEGLAREIVAGNVPDLLKNKIIYSLDIGSLVAGTKYRGSLEERLKNAIETIIGQKNIIVFIDEIHTLASSGAKEGEVNPSDMLKPYLARGELQTVGATTTDEYRKFIEKDKALERRFQPIMVNPPSVEETILILKGLRDSYEAFHKVKITDEAIETAATLSDRYIMDRSLPDKAIDLIDEASSRAKVNNNFTPPELKTKEEEIKQLEINKKEALMQENFEKAAAIRDQIKKAEEQADKIKNDYKTDKQKIQVQIGAEEVARVVSNWTKIPVTKITESEKQRLVHLEDDLHKRVIGQDEAVEAVAKAIRRARAGLKDPSRPIGSFLFLGQTGVGKTELSKTLAESLFDDENSIIRIDMSEYMESHSVSKLIGSPPGYIGYDEGGQLTEQVRRKPYSVVLFDEIEKAHADVYNALLQILDDGRLTDSQGRIVNFKNTVIIMTSNIGVNEIPKNKAGLGFKDSATLKEQTFEDIKRILTDAVKKHFKPEFINRIDVITVFKPLTEDNLARIAGLMIKKVESRLKAQKVELKLTEKALKYLVAKGYDADYGARPLRRVIEREIEDTLAEYLLGGKIAEGSSVLIDADDKNIIINI
ncbi:MAG: ATP-dependent Clp protease ATP-binding subunit [Clostridia bacterium]|nr:ATP-dependent Clp protease ATP-binding subunit [Clostridia bacterium]